MLSTSYFLLSAFLFGLIIGSFLNAVIYRLRHQQSLGGRSACPHCRHQLAAADLIPLVSYLMSRGKCRYCRKPIVSHYFWTELVTGLAFLGAAWMITLSSPVELFYNLFFISVLIFLAGYDWRYGQIPDQVSLPAVGLAVMGSLFHFSPDLTESLLGLLIGGGSFLLLVAISGGRWMGGGDIRLMALIGVLVGWPLVLVAIFFGSLAGSLVGLLQIHQQKKKLHSQLRSGPAFVIGGYITLLWGGELWTWYLLNFL